MEFLGPKIIKGYYPVSSRNEAVLVVQKGIFRYANGLMGSAVYIYANDQAAFIYSDWVVECEVTLKNAAGVSLSDGEFRNAFHLGPRNIEFNSSERQRHTILRAGYDGLVFDCGFIAVYGSLASLKAIKAYSKINGQGREQVYNTLWARLKRLLVLFKEKTYGRIRRRFL